MHKIFPALFKTSFLLLFARLAGAGTGILLQILIARHYGAEVLGMFYLALSLAAILSVIMSMGYPWIVAPIVAKSAAEQSTASLAGFLRHVMRDTVRLVLVCAVLVPAAVWVYPGLGEMQRLALLAGLATAPVYLFMLMLGNVANAYRFFQLANLPELVLRPLLTLLTIGWAIFFGFQLTSLSIISINLGVSIALGLWMAWKFSVTGAFSLTSVFKGEMPNSEERWQLRKLAVPMIFPMIAVSMFADLDILMVGLFLPVGDAGLFGVCIKIASLLVFIVHITHQILLRDVSDAHLAKDTGKMNETIRTANWLAVSTSLLSLAGIVLFGDVVLGFFGEEFKTGYLVLVGLVGSQVIRAAAGPAIQILMVTGHQREGVPVYVSSIAVLFIGNLLLVPPYGLMGATAAVIIATLFWTIWLNRLARKKTGYAISILGSIFG